MVKLVTLENMGAFFNSVCEIVMNKNENEIEIYCRCVNNAPECDMAQLGWGSYAYCPLYNFNYNIQDSTWKKHLESVNMSYLISIIEEKIKQI
jgi:hypothetical protein